MERPDFRGGMEQLGHMRGSPQLGLSKVTVVELMVINHLLAVKTKGHPFSQARGGGADRMNSNEGGTVLLSACSLPGYRGAGVQVQVAAKTRQMDENPETRGNPGMQGVLGSICCLLW